MYPFLLSFIYPSIHSLFLLYSPSFPHRLGCHWCSFTSSNHSFIHPYVSNDDVSFESSNPYVSIHSFSFIHPIHMYPFLLSFIHLSIHSLFLLHSPSSSHRLGCQRRCSFKSSNHSFNPYTYSIFIPSIIHLSIHSFYHLFHPSIPYWFLLHSPSFPRRLGCQWWWLGRLFQQSALCPLELPPAFPAAIGSSSCGSRASYPRKYIQRGCGKNKNSQS